MNGHWGSLINGVLAAAVVGLGTTVIVLYSANARMEERMAHAEAGMVDRYTSKEAATAAKEVDELHGYYHALDKRLSVWIAAHTGWPVPDMPRQPVIVPRQETTDGTTR